MVYLCCSFTLNAASTFPQAVHDIPAVLEQTREIAIFLTDLGSSSGTSALDSGSTLLRKIEKISSQRDVQLPSHGVQGLATRSRDATLDDSNLLPFGYESCDDPGEAGSDLNSYNDFDPFGFEMVDFDLLFSI
jgi:hypothetical protein